MNTEPARGAAGAFAAVSVPGGEAEARGGRACAEKHSAAVRAAKAAGRTPPAHPEGYLEAFANIYKNFANHIRAVQAGKKLPKGDPALDYPRIEDGVRGMAFIEAVVKSSKKNAAWTKLDV